MIISKYENGDLPEMTALWNNIVEQGIFFPQDEAMSEQEASEFFRNQSHTAAAKIDGEIVGLYILHPNSVGRCGHISNASYAVKSGHRGKRIGERLVLDSMKMAKELGFKILQFNAVVATNTAAIKLYEKLGFNTIGTIKGGYKLQNGDFEDIISMYIEL